MRKTIPRAKHVLSNVEGNAKGAKVSEKGIFLCDLGGLSPIRFFSHHSINASQ
jgi:hypothetical protein